MMSNLDILIINSVESLGILVLKTLANDNGLKAEYFVATNSDEIINKIYEVKPKILAVSWNFDYIIYDVLIRLKEIRKTLPDLRVTVGGYGATNDLNHLKEYPEVDIITTGESDDTFVPACRYLLSNEFVRQDKPKVIIPDHIPDLKNYNYNKNILVKNNVIYAMTSRNCIKGENRCWYCTCSKTGFRFLDIDKVIDSIKNVITKDTKQIVLADAEVISKTVNLLWNTFRIPLNCFMLARDLCNLDESLEGCHFIVGVDYYVPGKNGNFIDAQMIRDIKKCAEKNKISISSVYSEEDDPIEREKTFMVLKKLSEKSENIDVTFPKLVMYPGTNGVELEENIYLTPIDFEKKFTDIGQLGEFNTNGQDQISFTNWEEAFDIPS